MFSVLHVLLWTAFEVGHIASGGFCPGRFLSVGDSCYLFSDDHVASWDEAMDRCNLKGATLASIETDYESFLINHFILEHNRSSGHFWIGGTNRAGGDWEWAGTGKIMEHRSWCCNEPNNLNEKGNCVFLLKLQYQYCWRNTVCERENADFNYICERGFY